jgi:hypothetical protein
VRWGRRLSNRECETYARENHIGPGQWRAYVCVEEPFDRTNACRAVIKRNKFDDILESFSETNEIFRKKELEQIRLEDFIPNV